MHYREPSRAVIINKRRPALAVKGGSTRTTVRNQTSTTVRDSGTTRENVRAGAGTREWTSGAGNAGARTGTPSGQDGQPATSGRSGGGGASSAAQRGQYPPPLRKLLPGSNACQCHLVMSATL